LVRFIKFGESQDFPQEVPRFWVHRYWCHNECWCWRWAPSTC